MQVVVQVELELLYQYPDLPLHMQAVVVVVDIHLVEDLVDQEVLVVVALEVLVQVVEHRELQILVVEEAEHLTPHPILPVVVVLALLSLGIK